MKVCVRVKEAHETHKQWQLLQRTSRKNRTPDAAANEAFSTFSSKVDELLASLARTTDLIDSKLSDGATTDNEEAAFNAMLETMKRKDEATFRASAKQ